MSMNFAGRCWKRKTLNILMTFRVLVFFGPLLIPFWWGGGSRTRSHTYKHWALGLPGKKTGMFPYFPTSKDSLTAI
jgi:hypothetical protein